jgi:UDP:flavonoid glycosyltransferase YjiC (YdhE family)
LKLEILSSDTLNHYHKISYFISSHGFGHAARSSAVIQAVQNLDHQAYFEIFTQTPYWFFEESIKSPFNYTPVQTDVGLIQTAPMIQDLNATLVALSAFLKFDKEKVSRLASSLLKSGCSLVVSDISPLGIEVAKTANLPLVLVENFTWDWIYEIYTQEFPGFSPYIEQLYHIYGQVKHHIQTEPVCSPYQQSTLKALPASRKPSLSREVTRKNLGIPEDAKMLLITMGGIPEKFNSFPELTGQNIFVVVPGASQSFEKHGNWIFLPHHSNFYHPNLIHASDAVIGKAGYSTIAEVYQAGIPFGYIIRDNFRESEVLAKYIRQNLSGFEIPEDEFSSGSWLQYIEPLLSTPQNQQLRENGANQIARYILNILD